MAKIFISYRRDDDPNAAARVRDGLVRPFGRANVFLDVDHLLAGQRFDEELAKALAQCDVLIAIIGPRWMDLLRTRADSGERDYVREEIGEALKRRIVVIPVRVGRDGQLPPLPRVGELPDEIRELVQYQKHDVTYERFPRDIAELIDAITKVRRQRQAEAGGGGAARASWVKAGAAGAALAMLVGVGLWLKGADPAGLTPVAPTPSAQVVGVPPKGSSPSKGSDPQGLTPGEAERRRIVELEEEIRRRDAALVKAAADGKQQAEAAAGTKAAADAKAAQDAEAKRRADAAEAKRLADEAVARKKAEAEAMRPGRVFRDCQDCPEMVVLPVGNFTMGSNERDDEKPTRTVTIRQPFAVGKFEVTFAEWEACVAGGGCQSNRNPSYQGWGKGRQPVINVSWNDAKEYVSWLSRKTGQAYRLLTEAEWEFAARAGTRTAYPWGDEFDGSKANNGNHPVAVGQYPGNAFGLHDMHGNVWEWVEDCHAGNYNNAPTDGSAARETQGCSRVLRGGGWINDPQVLRSAYRNWYAPGNRLNVLGFRLARTIRP